MNPDFSISGDKATAIYETCGMGGEIGIKSQVARKWRVDLRRYAQHDRAILLYVTEPKKRNGWRKAITPLDSIPMFCIVVRGHHDILAPKCPIRAYELGGRPHEWPIVHEYFRHVSEQIAERHEVLFDWRDHFVAAIPAETAGAAS